MRTRIITSLVGLAILFPVLLLSDTWVLVIAASVLSAIAMFEMMRCIGVHRNIAATWPLYGMALGLPVAARLMGRVNSFGSLTMFLLMAYFFYLMALTVFSHRGLTFSTSTEIFSTGIYISLAFSSLAMLRDIEEIGQYLYLMPFLVAWVTDSFAYFTGRLFGKHKLIPAVSPKKTVEGAIGGSLFCVLACVLYAMLIQYFYDVQPNYLFILISALILSVCAQIGD